MVFGSTLLHRELLVQLIALEIFLHLLGTTQLPDFNDYDPSCTGPLTTVSITLPAGEAYQVTGIDISYTMTPDNGGLEFDQHSLHPLSKLL